MNVNEIQSMVRMSIAVSRFQLVTVQSHSNDGFSPIVIVETGPIITRCRTFAQVRVQAEAWLTASQKAAHVFPAGYVGPAPVAQRVVSAIVEGVDGYSFDCTAFAAAAATDRRPSVVVRVGPVAMRCMDAAAVETITEGWRQAERLAHAIWPAKKGAEQAPVL